MSYVKNIYIKTTLYALATVTESQFIKYSDTGGYAAADSSDTATITPWVALETASSGYFLAALEGIMAVGYSAAINPGRPVQWADTDKVRPADTNLTTVIGYAIEGSGDTAAVRTKLIFFGPGKGATASAV